MLGGSPAAAALPTKLPSGAKQSPCCDDVVEVIGSEDGNTAAGAAAVADV